MSNDHANSRIAAARKEAYDEGRADVLAKVEQVREWVENYAHSWADVAMANRTPDAEANYRHATTMMNAVHACLSEINRHFPKAKE